MLPASLSFVVAPTRPHDMQPARDQTARLLFVGLRHYDNLHIMHSHMHIATSYLCERKHLIAHRVMASLIRMQHQMGYSILFWFVSFLQTHSPQRATKHIICDDVLCPTSCTFGGLNNSFLYAAYARFKILISNFN